MAEKHKSEAADGEKARDMALFKFSLIAPVVADTFTQATKMDYYRETCSGEHRLPNGKRVLLSPLTINFLAAELRGICPNLALLGKILTAAELRGIKPVID